MNEWIKKLLHVWSIPDISIEWTKKKMKIKIHSIIMDVVHHEKKVSFNVNMKKMVFSCCFVFIYTHKWRYIYIYSVDDDDVVVDKYSIDQYEYESICSTSFEVEIFFFFFFFITE